MDKCDKCKSSNIKRRESYKYHDTFHCMTCGNWSFVRIEDCCRNSYKIVSQDHKYPDRPRLYKQCLRCGGCVDRTKPLNFKKHGPECEAEFSNYRFENWCRERNEEGKMLADSKGRFNYFSSPYYKYLLYLSSREWKEKRLLALQRDKYICQECNERPAEDVHHLSYDNLFHEPLEDLKSLCRKCHSIAHGKTVPEFITSSE